ncbi:Vigilin [Gryllus bimaculatus]|nr:Vigilin [Gryllus bimaculatus]
MQQAVMEEDASYEPPTYTYDEVFPALPESVNSSPTVNQLGQWNNKMRIGSSVVTQVFRVPFEERKFDHSDKFGEGESLRTCLKIMQETGAHIETSSSKDQSLTFLVSGKQNAVLDARRRILTQFQTQAKTTISIPKEHHRFILGKNGTKLKDLEKNTATKITVPSVNDTSEEITVTGTKEGIEKAVHEIQVTSDEQSKQACETVSVPKMYHPFITGAHHSIVNALMTETGVRINVPPPSVQKDEIIIAGEKEGVMLAKERIIAIHDDMQRNCSSVSVEVPKSQHKYVIGPRGSTLAEILQTYGVSVEMPTNESSTVTLRGPQTKLGYALNLVYEKANSCKATKVEAPNWIHKYIIGRKGAKIRAFAQEFQKVHVEFTDKDIHIEGPCDEVERAQARLQEIAQELMSELTFAELPVDPKFFKHIIGKNGANVTRMQNELGVTINISEADGSNSIRIEGNKEGVQKAEQKLSEMVFKLENEKEKDLIIEQRFHRSIIGSKGEKIRDICKMFNQVQITFPGPVEKREVVKVRGPREDVDRCAKYLMNLVKELKECSHQLQANIVTEEIVIPPKFYNSLIGAGGKLIHSIMDECGGVHIKFPPADSNSDKVTVRGPKDDVMKACQQLRELTSERQLSSFTATVRAKPQHHKFLIGKNGANIKKIRDQTGARIVFPSEKDEQKDVITIIGKQDAVEKARAQLEATIKEIDNIVESSMTVEPKHHRHFVMRRGEVLHRISEECGNVSISFPRPGVESDRVVLKGDKESIERARQRIEEIVEDLESRVTVECIIPQKHHRTVMGSKGCKVQYITSEHDVQIKFPERDATEESNAIPAEGQQNGEVEEPPVRRCDIILITGKQENCEAAKQALLDLVPVTLEVNVPFNLHRSIIGQQGQGVRELMDMYDVHIVLSPADQKLDVIKITGAPASVQRAKTAVEEICQDRILRSYEQKIEVDPEYHPKIIGRKGAVITKIRTDHDVAINFGKKGCPDENIITITGYEKNVNAAKESIMKIVNELNANIKEEVELDARVHSRLIGSRGRNIRRIMEQYKVDIKFPRPDGNPNLVTIIGQEENVQDARDHLLNLEEEFMQDVTEAEIRESYRPSFVAFGHGDEDGSAGSNGAAAAGFVVKGAPWEQRAPDTASTQEFPSFAGAGEAPPAAPPAGAWGSRRAT